MTKGEDALKLLIDLNEMDVQQYQKLVGERLGPEVLAVFESYCRELVPEDESQEVLGTLLHLMITGFLVAAHQQQPITGKIIKIDEP